MPGRFEYCIPLIRGSVHLTAHPLGSGIYGNGFLDISVRWEDQANPGRHHFFPTLLSAVNVARRIAVKRIVRGIVKPGIDMQLRALRNPDWLLQIIVKLPIEVV